MPVYPEGNDEGDALMLPPPKEQCEAHVFLRGLLHKVVKGTPYEQPVKDALDLLAPQPQQGITDIVCQWSDKVMVDDRPAVAGIVEGKDVVIGLQSNQGRRLFSIELGKEVPSILGPQTFRIESIHPGVLKLYPSLQDPQLHAFITIVGVPPDYMERS
jgi:hypothetical protein